MNTTIDYKQFWIITICTFILVFSLLLQIMSSSEWGIRLEFVVFVVAIIATTSLRSKNLHNTKNAEKEVFMGKTLYRINLVGEAALIIIAAYLLFVNPSVSTVFDSVVVAFWCVLVYTVNSKFVQVSTSNYEKVHFNKID